MALVEDPWSYEVVGNPMEVLFKNLKFLREFNRKHYSNVSERVKLKKKGAKVRVECDVVWCVVRYKILIIKY